MGICKLVEELGRCWAGGANLPILLWDLEIWDALVFLWNGSQPEYFSEENEGREGNKKEAC